MTDPEDPVEVAIEDALDLHSFPPRDIPIAVEAYLEAAREAGRRTVRLIHGRGRGVQRVRIIALLSRLPGVIAAREAPADLGGWGATIVELAPLGEADFASTAKGNPTATS
ncbi:MAG: Smr/MutS family protein [Acidobacteria bacterium]|nr:Smr/MutS family protein [Acidobacteriota bacterium]